jgi:microcystin-dependent protein
MRIKVYSVDVQLPRWLKRTAIFAGIPAAVLLGFLHYLRADVAVPNTFSDGDTLSATKMNANFSALQTGINTLAATVTTLQGTVAGSAIPSGTVVAFAGATAPAGWLLCDGSAVGRTQYAALFAAIAVTYGIGDAINTFNLPDLRGQFLRGLDGSGAVVPTQSGRQLGSKEASTFTSHTHAVVDPGHTHAPAKGGYFLGTVDVQVWSGQDGTNPIYASNKTASALTGISLNPSGSDETRPTNVAVNYLIKY